MEMPAELHNGQSKADPPYPELDQPQQLDHKLEEPRPFSSAHDAIAAVAEAHRIDPATLVRKLLKGKEKEWAAVVYGKQGKLTLLELPLDILRLIVSEVIHHLMRCMPYT